MFEASNEDGNNEDEKDRNFLLAYRFKKVLDDIKGAEDIVIKAREDFKIRIAEIAYKKLKLKKNTLQKERIVEHMGFESRA